MDFFVRFTFRGHSFRMSFGKDEGESVGSELRGDVYSSTQLGYGSKDDNLQVRPCGFAGPTQKN